MTDLEKFIDTYKQFGIEIKTKEENGKILVSLGGWDNHSSYSEKFSGYGGFFSDLEFTKDGKFISQGFWE
jgi:hypothetical protein